MKRLNRFFFFFLSKYMFLLQLHCSPKKNTYLIVILKVTSILRGRKDNMGLPSNNITHLLDVYKVE
jgi:hypothetical protein